MCLIHFAYHEEDEKAEQLSQLLYLFNLKLAPISMNSFAGDLKTIALFSDVAFGIGKHFIIREKKELTWDDFCYTHNILDEQKELTYLHIKYLEAKEKFLLLQDAKKWFLILKWLVAQEDFSEIGIFYTCDEEYKECYDNLEVYTLPVVEFKIEDILTLPENVLLLLQPTSD